MSESASRTLYLFSDGKVLLVAEPDASDGEMEHYSRTLQEWSEKKNVLVVNDTNVVLIK